LEGNNGIQLEELIAFLVTKGHMYQDVMEYGYNFFKTSLKCVEKEAKMQIVAMAMSIGLGLFGKEKNYKELME